MSNFYTPAQFEKISELLRTNYSQTDNMPVDITDIAIKYGCDVNEVTFDGEDKRDISGMVYLKDKKFHIDINKAELETRKRFTIAHELAHIILHGDELRAGGEAFIDYRRSMIYYEKAEDMKKEIQANMLAASLLMPKDKFETAYKALNNDIDDVANLFSVSKHAALVRLESLSIFD